MRKQLIFASLLMAALALGCKHDDPEPAHKTGKTSAIFNPDMEYGTVTDIDGNTYRTIQIGNQTWMAENLRVRHYRNGDPVLFEPEADWHTLSVGLCCAPMNTDNADSIATYGLLYNGYALLDSRGIAPAGWHTPSQKEWIELFEILKITDSTSVGSYGYVGGMLRETGDTHWRYPNSETATNSSGFTAIPAGRRFKQKFYDYKTTSMMWSTTIFVGEQHNGYYTSWVYETVGRTSFYVRDGFSIRCIKD